MLAAGELLKASCLNWSVSRNSMCGDFIVGVCGLDFGGGNKCGWVDVPI